VSHVYCPECGFQNAEAANFCTKCGAALVPEDAGETTMTFAPDEQTAENALALDELGISGPALVVRSGGGRAGESFVPAGKQTRIGRSPECEVFLDDVTVSRNHALLVERDGEFYIEDQSSLNGTFVNRRRIDSARIENGDELQIGKYRMTFVER
jgi:pSer/pThr/pTyr-binding forkhead associated (FHA) protein